MPTTGGAGWDGGSFTGGGSLGYGGGNSWSSGGGFGSASSYGYQGTNSTASAGMGMDAGGWGGLVAAGISGIAGAQAAKSAAKTAAQASEREVKLKGDEDRRSALYGTLLGEWKQSKDKYRKSQGLGNYRDFAKKNTKPKGAHSALMRNFESANRVQDPGEAPDAQALSAVTSTDKKKPAPPG